MIIVMKDKATDQQIDGVIKKLESVGAKAHISKGKYKTIIGAIGDEGKVAQLPLKALPGVEKVMPVMKPFKIVSREFKPEDTVININGVKIGGGTFGLIAGPCSVENEEQLIETAKAVKNAGATFLRGGAFKPRSSPYSFQGLGEEGLKILSKAREITGLPIVTEVMDVRDIDLVAEYADILQVGARNMQNFLLLTEIGKQEKPILLKRGFSNTIEESLMAAEYIANSGNKKTIICERGIRTFETYTRNTLDISAIPIIKSLSHLPVIVDPSHAAGRADIIEPLVLAALAAGADCVIVEVHISPQNALCDGQQSLTPEVFKEIVDKIKNLAPHFNKNVGGK
ncbi:MAG: 3-deoxy-7-phosphoheptulonate synthase [Actinomycetia bacterium]|nr:3-deoxy-7-phosphoheptulonate synthase [Actinomycetes bacterium]